MTLRQAARPLLEILGDPPTSSEVPARVPCAVCGEDVALRFDRRGYAVPQHAAPECAEWQRFGPLTVLAMMLTAR